MKMGIDIKKHTIFRIVELVLAIVLIVFLLDSSWGYNMNHDFLSAGTFMGFTMILAGLLAGEIMGTPIDQKIDLFYSVAGCVLFIVVGAIYVQEPYKYINKDKTKGSISIINGIIFLVDIILGFMDG